MISRLISTAYLALLCWLAWCAWTSLVNGAPRVALVFVGGSLIALTAWIREDATSRPNNPNNPKEHN